MAPPWPQCFEQRDWQQSHRERLKFKSRAVCPDQAERPSRPKTAFHRSSRAHLHLLPQPRIDGPSCQTPPSVLPSNAPLRAAEMHRTAILVFTMLHSPDLAYIRAHHQV